MKHSWHAGRDAGLGRLSAPTKPDVVAFSMSQIIAFVFRAQPGDVVYYYHGNLMRDAQCDPAVRRKARYVALCVDQHLLHPRQTRASDAETHYFAKRSDRPISDADLPFSALTGEVTADEYDALVALDQRQASASSQRAIRDALGTTEDAAAEMRNDFIRRGWLTNDRPPRLTDLGRKMMR